MTPTDQMVETFSKMRAVLWRFFAVDTQDFLGVGSLLPLLRKWYIPKELFLFSRLEKSSKSLVGGAPPHCATALVLAQGRNRRKAARTGTSAPFFLLYSPDAFDLFLGWQAKSPPCFRFNFSFCAKGWIRPA